LDDFYQGTKAAVAGGTTFVVDCVVPDQEESLLVAYNKWRGWADEKVCCDYGLRVLLPPHLTNDLKEEIEILTSSDFGVNTFFFDMSPKNNQ